MAVFIAELPGEDFAACYKYLALDVIKAYEWLWAVK